MLSGYWYNNKLENLPTGHLINAIGFIHNSKYKAKFKKDKINEILDELSYRDFDLEINDYAVKGKVLTAKNKHRIKANSINYLDTLRIIKDYYKHPILEELRDYTLKWLDLTDKEFEFKERESILDYI